MSGQSHKVGGWVFPTLLPPPSPPTMLEFWEVQRREVLTPLHPSLSPVLGPALAFCGCHSKLPQTSGFKQQDSFYHSLRGRKSEIKMALRRIHSLSLPVSGGHWHSFVFPGSAFTSSSPPAVCTCLGLSLIRRLEKACRAPSSNSE